MARNAVPAGRCAGNVALLCAMHDRAPNRYNTPMPRVAVVGHVEWIEFARVERLPKPGEIIHAQEWWEDVGGGGSVAAVQLAKLAGGADFFTALGDDERARASH